MTSTAEKINGTRQPQLINCSSVSSQESSKKVAGNPKVAMVSMTGSVSAGEKIMATAAKNITKVCLELGGKAPAIVMDDADIELAVKAI
ncbi:aldehyde dehydrogenase family protein, partial [Pseudomonas aeruginosa]|uniref:aldehyde dehydrogenase family protein n=1 Tax=Pseudomonas aeruginosa TaxID=287 RepID=UPI003CC7E50E